MTGKVSIILPTYNRVGRLKNAINYCMLQSYKNFELIIVDDGSTDSTRDVVLEYQKKYNNIKYIFQQNKGLPSALNTGFENSEGHYLTWTSDDNHFEENAIEVMVNKINEYPEPVFVYSDYYNLDEINDEKVKVDLNCENRIYIGNHIGACFMYSREIYNEIGNYDVTVRLAEDYDYWIRVFEKFPMIHIPEVLYNYALHDQSLTQTKFENVKKAIEYVQKKHDCHHKAIKFIESKSQNRPIFIWGRGDFGQRIYQSFSDELNILGFIDSFIEIGSKDTLFELPILNPKEVKFNEKPYIIIASTYRAEIEKELLHMDLNRDIDFY